MEKVIGLGEFGCGIAEEFSEYPEYRVYKIGTNLPHKGNLVVDVQETIKDYEDNVDIGEISIYLRSIKEGDEVLFVLSGGEAISGMALPVLEQLQGSKLNILYICPDRDMSSQVQKRDDRIVFNVLQQYARSGLFERLYLMDRSIIEEMIGEVSIKEYEKKINNFVAYVVAMINYFNHTDPVLSKLPVPPDLCRIATFGVSSLAENAPVKYTYPLKGVQDFHYYYGLPAAQVEEDAGLMRQIKQQTKTFASESLNVSFSIHSTTFQDPMVLCVAYTKEIQELISQ